MAGLPCALRLVSMPCVHAVRHWPPFPNAVVCRERTPLQLLLVPGALHLLLLLCVVCVRCGEPYTVFHFARAAILNMPSFLLCFAHEPPLPGFPLHLLHFMVRCPSYPPLPPKVRFSQSARHLFCDDVTSPILLCVEGFVLRCIKYPIFGFPRNVVSLAFSLSIATAFFRGDVTSTISVWRVLF